MGRQNLSCLTKKQFLLSSSGQNIDLRSAAHKSKGKLHHWREPMHVIGEQYSVRDHCLRAVLPLVTNVVLLACGCENSNGTTVTMKYLLGSSTVLEIPVRIESSRIAEGDWADGKSESLEVTWNRHPDVIFDEVWFGFDSSNLDERESGNVSRKECLV